MNTPIFFHEGIAKAGTIVSLTEVTAKHIMQVLRMKKDDAVRLANGAGVEMRGTIADAGKKFCNILINEVIWHEAAPHKNCIAISTLKNQSRLEWFLEKATELGIQQIILLRCARTEKAHYKEERWRNILIAAMLQSQQYFLPELIAPVEPQKLLLQHQFDCKYIAHCELDELKISLAAIKPPRPGSCIVLIGPEGDFSHDEIVACRQQGFVPVSLGNARLRTETAGLYAAFHLHNQAL